MSSRSPRFWFFPVWSGDIRLEKTGDESCLLTVEDPTDADKKRLIPFLRTMREMEYIDEIAGVQPKGITKIELPLGLETAGPMLAGEIHQDATLWTAVRFSDGSVTITDGAALPVPIQENDPGLAAAGGAKADVPEKEPQLPAVQPEAAATVQRPMRGCPAPAACERRASEVLRAFCTNSQWRQFQREGRVRAIGNHTGRAYYVYHRNEAARQSLTHSLVIAGTGKAICVWDDRVPPEEEVLGIKLAIEHRERWLRGLPRAEAQRDFRRHGTLIH